MTSLAPHDVTKKLSRALCVIIRIHYTLTWELDTCDSWEIKWFHTRLRRVWNCFIPHGLQVSIYNNQGVVDSLFFVSFTDKKRIFQPKTLGYQRLVICLTVVIQIRKWRVVARALWRCKRRLFMVQNNVRHPQRLQSHWYENISNTIVQVFI